MEAIYRIFFVSLQTKAMALHTWPLRSICQLLDRLIALCEAREMLMLHPVFCLCLKEDLQATKAFIWTFTPVDDC